MKSPRLEPASPIGAPYKPPSEAAEMSMDALYLSDKKERANLTLQEMYALDPYLEPHEIKRYQREQNILIAA